MVFFTRGIGMKIAMVDLRYPYGKQRVYLNGSLFTVASRFWHAGHDIEIIDFNIDTPRSSRVNSILQQADLIGVSVVGSPYMPQLIKFCRQAKKRWPNKPIILGGQIMRGFSREQFDRLFAGTNAILIQEDIDLVQVGIMPGSLLRALAVPLWPLLARLDETRLRTYLSNEMPLVISQGCMFNCDFCAADKDRPEEFKNLDSFTADLRFIARKALEFGLGKLEFYATNLDFFQTPDELKKFLLVIAQVRQETGVDIRLRALACMNTYLAACRRLPDLGTLLKEAGFWCVGFGVDGPNEKIWKTENKAHNHEKDISLALTNTKEMGLVTEVLMILGDKRYDLYTLIQTVHFCYGFVINWPHTVLRLHIAKVWPGSKGWKKDAVIDEKYVAQLLADPSQFFNLDALALASPITNPHRKQRWQVNLAYLVMLLPLRFLNKCVSGTILPQGGHRPLGLLGRIINPVMYFDR